MDKTKRDVSIFNNAASGYQDKYMSVELYEATLDVFCDAVKKDNASILELACGPGNVSKYLLSKRPNFKLLGTDLAPAMLELARYNNPNALFEQMDIRDLKNVDKTYDGLVCAFGLPYLSKEAALILIQDAAQQLNPKGIIYLSTMEDAYGKSAWQGPKDEPDKQLFMYFHEEQYLSEALIQNDFTLLEKKRIHSDGSDGKEVVDLVLIAKYTPIK